MRVMRLIELALLGTRLNRIKRKPHRNFILPKPSLIIFLYLQVFTMLLTNDTARS